MRYLLLLFVVTPIIEMWLLIRVGGLIGALPTIALVLLTAMIGLALLKQQGFSTLMRARLKMESGELPATEMLEGLFLAVGGALLLTPGFVTDAIGFACLLPGVRQLIVGSVAKRFVVQQMHVNTHKTYRSGDTSKGSHQTIDGEYRRDD